MDSHGNGAIDAKTGANGAKMGERDRERADPCTMGKMARKRAKWRMNGGFARIRTGMARPTPKQAQMALKRANVSEGTLILAQWAKWRQNGRNGGKMGKMALKRANWRMNGGFARIRTEMARSTPKQAQTAPKMGERDRERADPCAMGKMASKQAKMARERWEHTGMMRSTSKTGKMAPKRVKRPWEHRDSREQGVIDTKTGGIAQMRHRLGGQTQNALLGAKILGIWAKTPLMG